MPALAAGHSRVIRAMNPITNMPLLVQVPTVAIPEAAKVLIFSSVRLRPHHKVRFRGPWPPVRAPQGVGGATPAPGSNPRGPLQPPPGRGPHYYGLRCSLAPSSHHPHPPAREAACPTLPQCPSRPPSPLCRSYGLSVARTANIHSPRPRTAHASPHRPRGPPPLQHPFAHARPSPPRATHATAREPLPSSPPRPGSSSSS